MSRTMQTMSLLFSVNISLRQRKHTFGQMLGGAVRVVVSDLFGKCPGSMIQKMKLIEKTVRNSDQNCRSAEAIHLSISSSMSAFFNR